MVQAEQTEENLPVELRRTADVETHSTPAS